MRRWRLHGFPIRRASDRRRHSCGLVGRHKFRPHQDHGGSRGLARRARKRDPGPRPYRPWRDRLQRRVRRNQPMKLIVAIIQPHRIDAVREALTEAGVGGLTVSEVRGYGRQRGHKEVYRGAEYAINYVPKLKLEIAIEDEKAEEVAEVIMRAARTGKIGDGKIFILDLISAKRISTGEEGPQSVECQ